MCFLHGMRMCIWIGHNCWINFCHFFDIVNLVIFHPDYTDSSHFSPWLYRQWVSLVSATPLTVLYQLFWNFACVFLMVWGCACGLDIVVGSIFVTFLALWTYLFSPWIYRQWVLVVSATPLTVLYQLFWNFACAFFMVWGCACGLHIIVGSVFVTF